MSYASATGAQRREVNSAALALAAASASARAGDNLPSTDGSVGFTSIDAAVARMTAAMTAIGSTTPIGTNQFLLTSGTKVAVGTVTGTGTFGTPTIVAGVITGIVLSAS